MEHSIYFGSREAVGRIWADNGACFYRLPDFDSLLQTYVWQHYDVTLGFPEMKKFLDFWKHNLDGPLHSVRYAHKKLIGPNGWRHLAGEIRLH